MTKPRIEFGKIDILCSLVRNRLYLNRGLLARREMNDRTLRVIGFHRFGVAIRKVRLRGGKGQHAVIPRCHLSKLPIP